MYRIRSAAAYRAAFHRMSEQPYGQDKQKQSAGQGKNHLLAGVELQMLLVPRTDTGDADQQYRGYLAVHEMPS